MASKTGSPDNIGTQALEYSNALEKTVTAIEVPDEFSGSVDSALAWQIVIVNAQMEAERLEFLFVQTVREDLKQSDPDGLGVISNSHGETSCHLNHLAAFLSKATA